MSVLGRGGGPGVSLAHGKVSRVGKKGEDGALILSPAPSRAVTGF